MYQVISNYCNISPEMLSDHFAMYLCITRSGRLVQDKLLSDLNDLFCVSPLLVYFQGFVNQCETYAMQPELQVNHVY